MINPGMSQSACLDSSSDDNDDAGHLTVNGMEYSDSTLVKRRKNSFFPPPPVSDEVYHEEANTEETTLWLRARETLTYYFALLVSMSPWSPLVNLCIASLHSYIERVDRKAEETGKKRWMPRLVKGGKLLQKYLKLIVLFLCLVFAFVVFTNWMSYTDSDYVASTKPWHDNYSTLHSYNDVFHAFATGNVKRVRETPAGMISGSFPAAAPPFEHIEAQKQNIDSLKESLENDARDFCASRWNPPVVCPPMSGLPVSMITICGSGQHFYNVHLLEGKNEIREPHQLGTFLSPDDAVVKERGYMFGVSMRQRFVSISVEEEDWTGKHVQHFDGVVAIGVQVCLDLISGDTGSLLDPMPNTLFI